MVAMDRHYLPYLKKYLEKKIILISGPRQSGKTTVSKSLSSSFDYLNFDDEEDRKILREKSWDRSKKLLIFDELHKLVKWKQWLKGLYDKEGIPPSIVVTGSANLDSYKKVGDSLAGRYFHYRLHPLDIRELANLNPQLNYDDTLDRLLNRSGFPEPYLAKEDEFYSLWKKSHLDIILRQDLLDLEVIQNIKQIELLLELLKERVGSPLSYSSLARDLLVSDKTVKRWLDLLENMYVVFKIMPYSKNIARSILKKPKYYFYDNARVLGTGPRLENLVATSLQKEIHFRQDCLGQQYSLYYLSQKGEAEIDFYLKGPTPETNILLEVKNTDDQLCRHFHTFKDAFIKPRMIQLVRHLKREKTFENGIEMRRLGPWLASW
jgi:predicted AAA+ superfamily ATPase